MVLKAPLEKWHFETGIVGEKDVYNRITKENIL